MLYPNIYPTSKCFIQKCIQFTTLYILYLKWINPKAETNRTGSKCKITVFEKRKFQIYSYSANSSGIGIGVRSVLNISGILMCLFPVLESHVCFY